MPALFDKLLFEKGTLEKLWSSEKYFFSEYFMNDDGTVSMISANPTYVTLKNYSTENIGMKITNFKSVADIDELMSFLKTDKNIAENFEFIKEYFYKGEITVWKIDIEVKYPHIVLIGELIENIERTDFSSNTYRTANMKIEDMFTDTIMITKRGENFYIDMFSESIKKIFPKIKKNITVEEVFKEHSYPLKSISIMNACVSQNRVIRYYDMISEKNNEKYLVYIIMRPFIHDNISSIVLSCTFMSCDSFSKIVKPGYNEPERVINACLLGFVIIDCSVEGHVSVFDVNPIFVNFINKNEISIKSITDSSGFKKAIKSKLSICDIFKYKNSNDIEYMYSLNVVPIIENGNVTRAMITVIPTDDSSVFEEMIFSKLTPRESEIVRMVIKGYTNKYIAYTLNISEGTVKKILYNCYQKLGVKSRIEIIKMVYHCD